MASYEHTQLAQRIVSLDKTPADAADYAQWIKGREHVGLVRANAQEEELIVYASGPQHHFFVHTVAVPEALLQPPDRKDLLEWNDNPFSSAAGYLSSGSGSAPQIVRGWCSSKSRTLQHAKQLVFARDVYVDAESKGLRIEILQEYAHIIDVPCSSESGRLGRVNDDGDFVDLISVTPSDESEGLTLVTLKRQPLDQYLAACGFVLVQMFDFCLVNYKNFLGWGNGEEELLTESDELFYRQKLLPGYAGYTRGIQILRLQNTKASILASIDDEMFGRKDTSGVTFLVQDWRNECLREVSTDPKAATNYFARTEGLPFEMSPSFFRPEVMLKYKTNSEKYTIKGRDIYCHDTWRLQAVDVNDAGQVHAYLGYLRNIPYGEQLHWKAHNEAPRAPISERAMVHDFDGDWKDFPTALDLVTRKLAKWSKSDQEWWKNRDGRLFDQVNEVYTEAGDEWKSECHNLAILSIEGFSVTFLRKHLQSLGIEPDQNDRSLGLLERILRCSKRLQDGTKLEGLRELQRIRTTQTAHFGGREGEKLRKTLRQQHGGYRAHFRVLCQRIRAELDTIESAFR